MHYFEKLEKLAAAGLLVSMTVVCLLFILFAPFPGPRTANASFGVMLIFLIFYFSPVFCISASAYVHVERSSGAAFALVLLFGIPFFLFYSYLLVAGMLRAWNDRPSATAMVFISLTVMPALLCFTLVGSAVGTTLAREWNRLR